MVAVLNIAYPFAPVGPDSIGGAEQVLSSIDARLVRDGHGSIVLAASGSRVTGHLVTVPTHPGGAGGAGGPGWIDDEARARAWCAYQQAIARICHDHAVDVLHVHGGDFAAYLPRADVPVVATLHLPRAFYADDALLASPAIRICVSHAQRRTFEPRIEIAEVLENGVAVERYRPAAARSDFVLALGRICPEKGFELALRAARAAGLPLVLAGAVFPYEAHHRYATDVIAPLLDADRRWVGPVVGARKRALLARARCLAITSTVDETSSLVAMEALAAGTPVVALARGALPEIVEHGRTGLLVDDPAELAGALVRAGALASGECRAAACARFSASRMTSRYLDLYRRLARPRPARRRAALEIGVVTQDAALAGLAPEWDALCDRCPDATAFQRPGWLLAWRRWLGGGAAARVATLRRGDRLVGIVPLEDRGGTVRLIGEGVTDHLDAIAEPELEPSALTEAVVRAAGAARRLELTALRPGSPLLRLALGGTIEPAGPSPVVALDAVRAPRRVAYELRRLARHAPGWHDERRDAGALLAALFALHRARWATRGEAGVLADPRLEGFHREVARAMQARGLLRLIGLSLDGVLRAVLYGFADHGRFVFYLSGFDPGVARLSPGRLVVARALERAGDDGAFELDFLRGREPYKYEWGAVDRPASSYRATLEEPHARDSMDHR